METEINQFERVTDLKPNAPKNEDYLLNFKYKEGGFGWVVFLVASYTYGIIMAVMYNYSLIYNKFDIVYNNSENHVLYQG